MGHSWLTNSLPAYTYWLSTAWMDLTKFFNNKPKSPPSHRLLQKFKVDPSELVKVTFMVDPPEGNPPGIPIRLIGNIASLGNSFSDLRGGVSGIASRAPLLKYTGQREVYVGAQSYRQASIYATNTRLGMASGTRNAPQQAAFNYASSSSHPSPLRSKTRLKPGNQPKKPLSPSR